ncbi:hypothetical protein HPB47_024972 [Ixodes persulcatus]|uniref:Uncharacterized protein n=1 Tax=Ixodes persulcatus TaxID=34615 RepID=A0AC60Q408_IXOPE|nr:hypothetical protein HPB47_024972 [Ixodes persulcatus]
MNGLLVSAFVCGDVRLCKGVCADDEATMGTGAQLRGHSRGCGPVRGQLGSRSAGVPAPGLRTRVTAGVLYTYRHIFHAKRKVDGSTSALLHLHAISVVVKGRRRSAKEDGEEGRIEEGPRGEDPGGVDAEETENKEPRGPAKEPPSPSPLSPRGEGSRTPRAPDGTSARGAPPELARPAADAVAIPGASFGGESRSNADDADDDDAATRKWAFGPIAGGQRSWGAT